MKLYGFQNSMLIQKGFDPILWHSYSDMFTVSQEVKFYVDYLTKIRSKSFIFHNKNLYLK